MIEGTKESLKTCIEGQVVVAWAQRQTSEPAWQKLQWSVRKRELFCLLAASQSLTVKWLKLSSMAHGPSRSNLRTVCAWPFSSASFPLLQQHGWVFPCLFSSSNGMTTCNMNHEADRRKCNVCHQVCQVTSCVSAAGCLLHLYSPHYFTHVPGVR